MKKKISARIDVNLLKEMNKLSDSIRSEFDLNDTEVLEYTIKKGLKSRRRTMSHIVL